MAQTNINIRMDEDLKKQAEILFSDLGLNMSTAFNMFVRQAVRTGGIPFEITTKIGDSTLNALIKEKLMESLEYAAQPNAVRYTKQEFFDKVRGDLL